MDISNSLVSTQFPRAIQDNRQQRPEQESRVEAPTRRSENGSTDIDSDELQRRGRAIEQERVQRLDNIESAPLRTQQALNTYQQTESAAQEFEQGELVGVDLFV